MGAVIGTGMGEGMSEGMSEGMGEGMSEGEGMGEGMGEVLDAHGPPATGRASRASGGSCARRGAMRASIAPPGSCGCTRSGMTGRGGPRVRWRRDQPG